MINGLAAPAGAGNYKFMLTATDGQLPGGGSYDKFRIKIWYEVERLHMSFTTINGA